MPGVLPTKLGLGKIAQSLIGVCDACKKDNYICDAILPTCSPCASVGERCTRNGRNVGGSGAGLLEDRIRWLENDNEEMGDAMDDKIGRSDLPRLSKLSEGVTIETGRVLVESFELEVQIDKRTTIAHRKVSSLSEIPDWIGRSVPVAGHHDIDGESSMVSPALRLLIMTTPKVSNDVQPAMLQKRQLYHRLENELKPVLDALDLHPEVLDTYGSVVFTRRCVIGDFATTRAPHENCTPALIYHIGYGFFSLAYKFFPGPGISVGVLLVQEKVYTRIADRLLCSLCSHQVNISNRAILSLKAHQAIGNEIRTWLKIEEASITSAQSQTGYHHNIDLKKTGAPVDFSQLSAKVSGIAMNIATIQLCWQILGDHADLMKEDLREYAQTTARNGFDTAQELDMISDLARNARFMQQEADSWQKKASIQVQGLFNLIAQRDQTTNIGIARDSRMLAEDSKRDSTSMKAIATVTMSFLPGTFVASLFAIPIFQWNAERDADVVNHRFWVYWAVTIPLTLSSFLAWVLWLQYMNDRRVAKIGRLKKE